MPNDKLDAAERGLEWGAALLKARGSLRHSQRLHSVLSSPATSTEGRSSPERRPRLSVSPDQESLFERLRLAVPGREGGWDCTIEGTGSRMRVWLAEPVTKRVIWSRSGSSAQVLAAFSDWLSMRA